MVDRVANQVVVDNIAAIVVRCVLVVSDDGLRWLSATRDVIDISCAP